jgi:hypothetical protein
VYRTGILRGFRHEATLTLPDARRGIRGIGRGGRRSAARRIILRLFFGFIRFFRFLGFVRLVGRRRVDQLGRRLVIFRRRGR